MVSGRKKILWLASWYPNRDDPFDGDFIQRHARAAAQYNDIHVIVVKESTAIEQEQTDWTDTDGLMEQIIYYKPGGGILSSLKKQLKWRQIYINAVLEYIKKVGKPDLIHVHVPWKAGLIALELKIRFRIEYIITEHWGIYNRVLKENYYTKPLFFRYGLKLIVKNARLLVSPSEYLAKSITTCITPINYTIIPNVVNTALFQLSEEKHQTFTFLHVSNMVPLKNVDSIIRAFKHFTEQKDTGNAQLILVGNRDDSYVELTRNLGLLDRSVFFKGEITYLQVAKEMQQSHCMLLFSDIETFSCVTAESLCCGIPVIAKSVGSLPELINETNGLLIEQTDASNGLEKALAQMKLEYHLYDKCKIAEEAQLKYSYNTIGTLFKAAYDKL